MDAFKKYVRTNIAEMREVTAQDIKDFATDRAIHSVQDTDFRVSISGIDKNNGSPKIGDMIARNPINHNEQWLVAADYFNDNFKPFNGSDGGE